MPEYKEFRVRICNGNIMDWQAPSAKEAEREAREQGYMVQAVVARQYRVAEELHQKCGGGRRIIRKKIGGD